MKSLLESNKQSSTETSTLSYNNALKCFIQNKIKIVWSFNVSIKIWYFFRDSRVDLIVKSCLDWYIENLSEAPCIPRPIPFPSNSIALSGKPLKRAFLWNWNSNKMGVLCEAYVHIYLLWNTISVLLDEKLPFSR